MASAPDSAPPAATQALGPDASATAAAAPTPVPAADLATLLCALARCVPLLAAQPPAARAFLRGFPARLLLESPALATSGALEPLLQAVLTHAARAGLRCSHALLACEGSELACRSTSRLRAEGAGAGPAAQRMQREDAQREAGSSEEGGEGGEEEEEDFVAPVCQQHAALGYATHAGLFAALHGASAGLVRVGNTIRDALAHAAALPAAQQQQLLLLGVEGADLLFSASAAEAPRAGLHEGLAALVQWASCSACWAAARGGSHAALPPVLTLLTAAHHGACRASGWQLPREPTATFTAASLASLARQLRGVEGASGSGSGGGGAAPAAGQAPAATLALLLPLLQLRAGRGSDASDASASSGAAAALGAAAVPVEAWVVLPESLQQPQATVAPGQAARAPSAEPGAAGAPEEGAWGEFCGFEEVKLLLLRRVIMPLLAALAQQQQQQQQQQQLLELLPGEASSSAGGAAAAAAAAAAASEFALLLALAHPRAPAQPPPAELARLARLLLPPRDPNSPAAATPAAPAPPPPPPGLLLLGPPGSGKTLLARALARAAGAALLHVSCPQLLSRYVGESERNIRSVFAAARAASPCLLLLDDVDAIAGVRGGGGGGGGGGSGGGSLLNSLVATLLTEMEGVGQRSAGGAGAHPLQHSTPLVLVVATLCTATGGGGGGALPPQLDAALLRPGRLEVHVALPLPGAADRAAIVRQGLRSCAAAGAAGAAGDDAALLDALAASTQGWSCSQLRALVVEAGVCAEGSEGGGRLARAHFVSGARLLGMELGWEERGEEVEGGGRGAFSSAAQRRHSGWRFFFGFCLYNRE